MLEDGRMIPSCSMWSNSWRAFLSRSGVRQQGRAETGGPVVSICVTSCFTGSSVVCITMEKSESIFSNADIVLRGRIAGLGEES